MVDPAIQRFYLTASIASALIFVPAAATFALRSSHMPIAQRLPALTGLAGVASFCYAQSLYLRTAFGSSMTCATALLIGTPALALMLNLVLCTCTLLTLL